MEIRKLTDAQVAQLREPLPAEAVKPHPTKSFLSTINAIYVTERLNEVFGIGSWQTKSEIIDNGQKMVVVKTTLTIPEYGISYECFGGNDNADRGDAHKGAVTDAITKIGSWLGIGAEVWKDEVAKPQRNSPAKPKSQAKATPAPQPSAPSPDDDNLLVALQEVKEAKTVDDLAGIKKRWRESLGINNQFVNALTQRYNAIINS